jgi:menaquinone-dependent protoporphyrinogen oxidase
MRILIAYAGKNGTTAACVEHLAQGLSKRDVTVVDLAKETVDPSDFDMVVFGSSVYFGRLRPEARAFLKKYESVLCEQRLILFLCCGIEEEYDYYREKLFSQPLRDAAFLTLYFGGSLKTEGLPFFDKLMIRSMRSALFEAEMDNGEYNLSLPGILPENIDKLATYLRKELERK